MFGMNELWDMLEVNVSDSESFPSFRFLVFLNSNTLRDSDGPRTLQEMTLVLYSDGKNIKNIIENNRLAVSIGQDISFYLLSIFI